MEKDYMTIARALVSDKAAVQMLRGLAPKDDLALERLYWNGYGSIRGSVIAVLYPIIKCCPELNNEDITNLALRDEERMQLLARNLQWEDAREND